MNRCDECQLDTELDICPDCGAVLSDEDGKMEALIQSASIPNLASLFQAGKDRGLIKASAEYGNPA